MSSIAAALPADVDAIHAMIVEFAAFERLSAICTVTAAELGDALFGPQPSAEVLLARDGDVLAGFALFYPNYSTFLGKRGLWLEDLYVRPAFRGRGMGRALLARVAALAQARGSGRFEWSVLDWNVPAIEFYRALGATLLPDWRIVRVTGDALGALARRSN